MPYKNDYFDTVSCISVLEHISHKDQIRGIKEMCRVLKKGGKLIITYDQEEDLTERFIEESCMTPFEIVQFNKPKNLFGYHRDLSG